MRLNISAWSIRRPVPAIVLFSVLTLLGIISFMTLPVTRFPNIDIPLVSITVVQSGAAPAELESQVTKEVEDAVANITGVKHIMSTVTDGMSTTVMEFRLEINQDRALNDVKDAIDKIRLDLPRDINEPIVQRIDVEGQSILTFAASSPGMTLEQLSWHVDDVIKRQLQGLKGVGRVERYGGVDREIRILLDPDRLLAFGITAAEVNDQVRATNVDLGGGRGEVGGQEQAIRTLAGARRVEELAETKILLPGGRHVRLSDLGKVMDDASEQRSFARLNGEPVVTFSVFRSKGSSELSVADVVNAKLAELGKQYPDVRLTKIDDAVAYTRGNYTSAMETLIEGAVLAVLVVLVFLRNMRATLIAAVALPLSAIPTFWAMELLGFSLNLVSLLGITLVTGILVDDAIVEIENIVRHMRTGKSPYRAAVEAADEIGLAVIAISLTIVAIFSPVSFMGGIAGQYFRQFGLTVAIAVLISLLVARLITPMMAAYLLRPIPEKHEGDGFVMRGLRRFPACHAQGPLPHARRRPRPVRRLDLRDDAAADRLHARRGHLARRRLGRVCRPARRWKIRASPPTRWPRSSRPSRRSRACSCSAAARRPAGSRCARPRCSCTSSPKTERALPQKTIKTHHLRQARRDARHARLVRQRARRARAVVLDAVAQRRGAERRGAQAGRRAAPGAGLQERRRRRLDRPAGAARRAEVRRRRPPRRRPEQDRRDDPRRHHRRHRRQPRQVQRRRPPGADPRADRRGRAHRHAAPAEPARHQHHRHRHSARRRRRRHLRRGPSSISRYDRERRAVIGVDLESRYAMSDAREKFLKVVDEQKLPASVRLQPSGDAEMQDEVATGFMTAMGTGLMIVFGVLVLLFGSVAQPITILLSLPLSFGGVVLALLATNNSVSMPVYIGLLMLMGIVTKNAIMLVDFAVEEVAKGVPRVEAVIDAGRKRARPIVMTTLAMVAGMIPSAMALGDGGEFRAPMAIAVIGGLLVSTVLSLVFVPSFFTVMDDVGRFVWWIFGRFVGPTDESPEYLAAHRAHAPGPARGFRAGPGRVESRTPPSRGRSPDGCKERGSAGAETLRSVFSEAALVMAQPCVRPDARVRLLPCRGCNIDCNEPSGPPGGFRAPGFRGSGPLAAALLDHLSRAAAKGFRASVASWRPALNYAAPAS